MSWAFDSDKRFSAAVVCLALAAASHLLACAQAHDVDNPGASGSLSSPSSDGSAGSRANEDPDCEYTTSPPESLECTGLYSDIEEKTIASGVMEFKPSAELWSDGARKTRWIWLPDGETIDAGDPESWEFPSGTQLFKEFVWEGQRVETRLFEKREDGRWMRAAYRWSEDEKSATRYGGGDVEVGGDPYHIPTGQECDQCHKGRDDRALGFEQVLLGLDGARGLTLGDLTEDDMISDLEASEEIEIGDDGTGVAAEALAWLHVNCGVSCHNDNPSSDGYSSLLRLMINPEDADGRSPEDFPAIATTVNVDAETPRWQGQKRIVPGSPEDSLLYRLITTRDPENPKDRMPPIASRIVDEEGAALIEEWIRSMPTQ